MSTDSGSAALNLPPRLQLERKLGEGAFGNVYEVFDREQQSRVALKSLERLDAHSLYRFKREFRELADISHPNLVRLHELFCFEDRWFFTMDLIRGPSFIDYVRPGGESSRLAPTMTRAEAAVAATLSPSLDAALDERRLRSGLAQLVEGVGALHAEGKLHRDLKPQNVLVSHDGRVIILDFGLVDDIHPSSRSADGPYEVVGTPAYMAPEQAAGQCEGPESDWYSIGVMLYEALTGRLPFDGSPMSMLLRKQTTDPPNPAPLLSPSLADLSLLSLRLLSRNPEDRPSFDELRQAFDGRVSVVINRRQDSAPSHRESDPGVSGFGRQPAEFLVGRERELEAMAASFRKVVEGRGVMVRVCGRSGMGKTALVRSFVEELRRTGQATTLMGRCFECESVPYKALDSLVDALAQRLLSLGTDQVAPLLPPDLGQLPRLFPVLRRVPLIADAPRQSDFDAADPHDARRSAFAALRALLTRLSERSPLVMWIDDLQWGDEDSASFLAGLLQPPSPPRALLIVSYRAEDVGTSRILQLLGAAGTAVDYERNDIDVGPLASSDCEQLAALLAGEEDGRISQPPEGLAEESGGSPLFLLQLVRHVARGGHAEQAADVAPAVRLDDVLWEHVCSLPEPAQRLLQAVCLAGRSVELSVARKAAGIVEELRESVDALRKQRLVRTQGMRSNDLVEPYHDRIREVVSHRLQPDARRQVHRALASTLEASGRADPEALALHYRMAGNTQLAWQYAVLAADRAANALAFRRAADLYREALALDPGRDTQALRLKLADALANAGHGAEASSIYEEAAATASARDSLDLRRKAAEQALRVGHVDKGLTLLQDMLRAAGMSLPSSPFRALALLLLRRAWLRIRGFGYKGRYTYDQEALRRIDVGWALATGLSNSDAIRGAEMQTRTLLLALKTGEPSRIARGLGLEGGFLATAGHRKGKRAAALIRASESLAEKLGDAYSLGYSHFGAGAAAYFEARYRDCLAETEIILQVFSGCSGVSWERTTARHYALWSLMWLGRIREASDRVRSLLQAAIERGDLYSATDLRLFTTNLAWLAEGDVQGARQAVDDAMASWSKRGFHAQHYYAMYALAQIDLYEGDGVGGLRRLAEAWPAFQSSMLPKMETVLVESLHLRARCALAAARQDPAREHEALRLAESDARRLARQGSPCSVPASELVRAAVDLMRGRRERCAERLQRAARGFDQANMALYAAFAWQRLAAIDPGTDPQAVAEAARWIEAQRLADARRWADMLAPGFEPRRALPAPSGSLP